MRFPNCFLLLIIAIMAKMSLIYGRNGVLMKRLETCDPNFNYDLKLNISFNTVGNKQYFKGVVKLEKPVDNNLISHLAISSLTGNQYVHLLDIQEKKSCDALHKYLGEFIYEIERHVQLLPGICPIPKGTYRLQNFLMKYEKITTLVNFPFGNLRIIDSIHDKNNNTFSCVILEAEHYAL